MKRDVTGATLVADAEELARHFLGCELSLIIIEGEAVSEFHSHNPRQTLDRYGISLINDEDHQDPFGGEAGAAFTTHKNALFRDFINFSCQQGVQCALVCFDPQGVMFDYSQPDASEVLSRYYEIGGQSQSAPLVPPEPLPSTASRMFDLFTHYSQGMLAQESLAAGQRRRVDALERSQAEMQRAMDERDQELSALNKGMQELHRLNMALEDKVAALEAENAQLRALAMARDGPCTT